MKINKESVNTPRKYTQLLLIPVPAPASPHSNDAIRSQLLNVEAAEVCFDAEETKNIRPVPIRAQRSPGVLAGDSLAGSCPLAGGT